MRLDTPGRRIDNPFRSIRKSNSFGIISVTRKYRETGKKKKLATTERIKNMVTLYLIFYRPYFSAISGGKSRVSTVVASFRAAVVFIRLDFRFRKSSWPDD